MVSPESYMLFFRASLKIKKVRMRQLAVPWFACIVTLVAFRVVTSNTESG